MIGSKILEHVLGIYKTFLKSANGKRKRGKGGTKCSNWDRVEIIWDGDGDKASTKFQKNMEVSKNRRKKKGKLRKMMLNNKIILNVSLFITRETLKISKKHFREGKDQRLFQTALT